MRKTKLILIEGIPGSGKSTMALYISRLLRKHSIPHIWHYEEDKAHPLYLFHDTPSMQGVLDKLATDERATVIAAVLERWQQLVATIQASETVVILDSCLFGYLTWTLFPLNVPFAEIQAYLTQVEEIIAPLNPSLIYLYQDDLALALKKLMRRRGTNEEDAIRPATTSAYGQVHNLQGFKGLLQYWTDYRNLTDTDFASIYFAKISLENAAGDWHSYEQQVSRFLELPPLPDPSLSLEELALFTGTYRFIDGAVERACRVYYEQGYLFLDGIPCIWPNNRLIPLTHQIFAIDSFPYEARFETDAHGAIYSLTISGPEQLFCSVNRYCVRDREVSS